MEPLHGYILLLWVLIVSGDELDTSDLTTQTTDVNGYDRPVEKPDIPVVNHRLLYQSIVSDFWSFRLSDVPEFATTVGVHQYDNKLERFTPEAFREKERQCVEFLGRIDKIDQLMLTVDEHDNLEILKYQLEMMVKGYTYRRYGAYNPVNHLEGVHRDTSLWINAMNFNDEKDFLTYRHRLRALAKQINEQIHLMKEAIDSKTTHHRVSIKTVPLEIDKLLHTPIRRSEWFKPYNDSMENTDISKDKRSAVKQEGFAVLQNNVIPAYRKLKRFIVNEYLPNCRQSVTVSSLIGGFEYYTARLQWYLSETVSPYSLYRRGLDAIKVLMNRVEHVKESVGYIGKLEDFLRYAQGASKFFFTSEEQVLEEYRVIVKDKILTTFPFLFHNVSIPDFVIQSMPFDGPDAAMMPGSEGMPGVLFVNVKNPFERPKWKMKAIALRETIPGRLFQMTKESGLPLPNFRKYREFRKLYSVPFQYPFDSAYTEGWALYAESLGYEMNIYLNPYDELGHLFSELHQLALMVTDTGIHALSWTRHHAIQYLHKTTGISSLQSEQEVDRIITLPGQACAPAYAFIKLRQLKRKAKDRFGSYFNIKDFHERILRIGPVPLYMLEKKIDRWIKEETPEYKPVVSVGTSIKYCIYSWLMSSLFILVFSPR